VAIEKQAQQLVRAQLWQAAIEAYRAQYASSPATPGRGEQLERAMMAAANAGDQLEAIQRTCQLLAMEPRHPHAARNLAVLISQIGDSQGALVFADLHRQHHPRSAAAWNTYGQVLHALDRDKEAQAAFEQAIALDPANADAHTNLAGLYHLVADLDRAFLHGATGVTLQPERLVLWLDHLIHLQRVCAFDRLAAVPWWPLLQRQDPELVSPVLLMVLGLAESAADQQQVRRLIERWGDHKAAQAAATALPPPPPLPADPGAVLDVGFVSADLRDHSVARFLWPLFDPQGGLDRRRFRLHAYSTRAAEDPWRQRFREAACRFHDVETLSPRALAQRIRADGVHVLFDLTGFTHGSRTASFAWKPAPVQVAWLGFPGTTGLPQMDHLFLDRHLCPADLSLIREQPLRSAGSSVCFDGLEEVPITPELPEQRRGFLTLGSLNNAYKFNPATIRRWAAVMRELPDSRFLFVRREFDSHHLRRHLVAEFAKHGIEEHRLSFYNNRRDNRHYLDCYNEIDFSLDTFPVTGGTTTVDALWMGVPVVALEGANVHQRVCSAILRHAGHPEWIAHSDDSFQRIALALAADQPLRRQLRHELREQLRTSALCDTRRFVADFAAALEGLRPG
jgi:predicted O-linked N-acetylglucosamine transferase (SPINDLY family)